MLFIGLYEVDFCHLPVGEDKYIRMVGKNSVKKPANGTFDVRANFFL